MRALRFIHVYATLMVLAAACAFLMPVSVSQTVRRNVGALFYPVARPANLITGWLSERLAPTRVRDDGAPDPNHPREVRDLLRENQDLRVLVGNLTGRMAALEQVDKELASIGDVRELCTRFGVIGVAADPAMKEALHITGRTDQGVAAGAPVLYAGVGGGGIAGRVASAQLGGSTVRLITDRGFTVDVGFARFTAPDRDGKVKFDTIPTPPAQAVGDGQGSLWIRNLPMEDAKTAGLQEGDWVILVDSEWPDLLQRYRLGRIRSVVQHTKGPKHAEIKVEPGTDLLKLQDVLVVVRRGK